MAEKPRKRSTPAVLRSAGRTALSLLRQTRQRAKMGTLHLPIDLHPLRQQTILLPLANSDSMPASDDGESRSAATPAMADEHSRRPRPSEETRALRSRLGVAERRVLRLRQALERERRARTQAGTALAQPRAVIDHLVADLRQIETGDSEAIRRTITQVLGAYGFAVDEESAADTDSSQQALDEPTAPSIPGWDRKRLQVAMEQILARHPDTGVRAITLALKALVRHGAVTPSMVASEAGLTSALARHRLRIALEGLCVAGVAQRDGQRFRLATPPRQPSAKRAQRR